MEAKPKAGGGNASVCGFCGFCGFYGHDVEGSSTCSFLFSFLLSFFIFCTDGKGDGKGDSGNVSLSFSKSYDFSSRIIKKKWRDGKGILRSVWFQFINIHVSPLFYTSFEYLESRNNNKIKTCKKKFQTDWDCMLWTTLNINLWKKGGISVRPGSSQ